MHLPLNRSFWTLSLLLLSQFQIVNAGPTWVGTTSNMSTTTNWNPNVIPIAGNTAQFQGPGMNPSLIAGNTLTADTFQFDTTPHAYTFTIDGMGTILTLGIGSPTTGVDNSMLGSPVAQIFNITNNANITFVQSGSADVGNTGTITYNLNSSPGATTSLSFINSSLAGKAIIHANGNATGPANVSFNNNSNPESSTITASNFGNIIFNTTSGATVTTQPNVSLSTSANIAVAQNLKLASLVSADSNTNADIQNGATLNVGDTTTGNVFQGSITNSGGNGILRKQGTGDFTITNSSNSYDGGTFVDTGTLIGTTSSIPEGLAVPSITIANLATLNFNDTTAGNFTGAITDNGTLTYTGSANSTLSGAITGTGNFIVNTTGSVEISNITNAYSNGTTVTAGTLIANTQSLPTTGARTIASGTTLNFNDAVAGNFTGAITDNGTVTYTGSANSTLSGAITGTGNFIVNATGSVEISNTTNSYSNGTIVTAGTLIANTQSLPTTGSRTIASGATLNFNDAVAGNFTAPITDNGTLTYSGSANSTLSGAITGTGNLIVNATGSVEIPNTTNAYSNGTIVTAGTLIANMQSLPTTGTRTIASGGTLNFNDAVAGNFTGSIIDNGELLYSGTVLNAILSGNVSGTGNLTINTVNGSLILNGTNSYSGGTTITQGILITSTSSLPVAAMQPSVNISSNGVLFFALPGIPTSYSGNINDNGLVGIGTGITAVLSGNISGNGLLTINKNADLTLTGTNSYLGATGVAGTLHTTAANLPTGNNIITVMVLPTDPIPLIDFTTTVANETFSGPITGPGEVQMSGTGHLTLTGPNNYTGGTNITSGRLTGNTTSIPVASTQPSISVGNATFEFNQNTLGTFAGNINLANSGAVLESSGTAALEITGGILGLGKLNVTAGQLTLSGVNNYTGGSTIASGATLTGNTSSLQGAIADNGTLVFNQNTNGTFNGTFTGNGSIQKNGNGVLAINTLNSAFAGTTNVTAGGLNLNSTLGGNVNIVNAVLSGNGTINGNLSLLGGSIITPGNSIGTINVGGNYSQTATDVYQVEINGTGQSDLINVAGNAALAGTVQIISLDGVINPAITYDIFHANGVVTGTFQNVVTGNPFIVANLSYVTNFSGTNVFLNLESVFNFIAETPNQIQVGNQLASIVNPSPELAAILTELAVLAASPDTIDLARLAYDQMSGEQYTNAIDAAEINGHQFLRRLYDPIRSIVTTAPRCDDTCCDPCPSLDVWLEGGGGRTVIEKNSNFHGFHFDSYEITGGVQSTFAKEWTVGLAGSYANDKVHYRVGGNGKNQTGFAGLYGLYRPSNWYVLADAAFGYTENKVTRFINVGPLSYTTHGKPKIYQGTGYIEAGIDLGTDCFLLQPFVGFEVGYFKRNSLTETGTSPLNLIVSGKQHTNSYSRLGMHLTSSQLPYNTAISLDIAWQYRLTKFNNTITERFQSFGDTFAISGQNFNRNSVDGALTISTVLGNNWEIFAEASGEAWSRAYTYNFLGGVKFSW